MRSFIIRALILTLTLFNSNFIHAVNPSSYLVPRYKVGDYAEGGVIFFVTPDGNHGLVASIEDISTDAEWGLIGDTIGATADFLGFGENFLTAGKINTQLIVDKYPTGSYAANLCKNYSVNIKGKIYNDWYLPSLVELRLMMQNRGTINNVSVAHGGTPIEGIEYWSSTEEDYDNAFFVPKSPENDINFAEKDRVFWVRAVRVF